ncbi:hypothetical protein ILYODFUR_034109 [Ilyodon furcidens]|uniref:Uncharacterized protein n=1 Tax=Ilyodon furcidens TaxID=33524 RepID=A0ABV0TDD2_9TELE
MSLSDWLTLRLSPGQASGIFPFRVCFGRAFHLCETLRFGSFPLLPAVIFTCAFTFNHLNYCCISIRQHTD